MRDTSYATELARADIGGQRIERLFVKSEGVVEIRFSWWRDGGMPPRPLDLPEDELLPLNREAIRQGGVQHAIRRGSEGSPRRAAPPAPTISTRID